jgi:hypothetical protein
VDVFRVLYKDICYQAYLEVMKNHWEFTDFFLPSGFLTMIEVILKSNFDVLQRSATNRAADSHRQALLKIATNWLSIRSDNTCLVCIRRTPHYGLPCGHIICENCVRVFGRPRQFDPWTFEVDSCFFCGMSTSGVVVKIHPPTAGVRVLTLDGGGIRGVASLQYLHALQERIGLPYPVQENFDVVYGTSIGNFSTPCLGAYITYCLRRNCCTQTLYYGLVD